MIGTRQPRVPVFKSGKIAHMSKIPKNELSPDNGTIIDSKWTLGSLSFHASAADKEQAEPYKEMVLLPELVIFDLIYFKGDFARTNLKFNFIVDFWNDRISC